MLLIIVAMYSTPPIIYPDIKKASSKFNYQLQIRKANESHPLQTDHLTNFSAECCVGNQIIGSRVNYKKQTPTPGPPHQQTPS